MLPPIWDSTTKLENVSQYATLLEYCPAKFSKTKFPCNSTAYGFKTLFFINWSRGFCRYACINSLIVVCRSFDSAFLDLTPTQKQKLEVAKSSRNCNAPNLCNLQFYYVDMQTEFYSPAIFCITPSM